ncbi:MAG: hypothetical protein ACKVPJ_01700 [Chitinophagales bacterium]
MKFKSYVIFCLGVLLVSPSCKHETDQKQQIKSINVDSILSSYVRMDVLIDSIFFDTLNIDTIKFTLVDTSTYTVRELVRLRAIYLTNKFSELINKYSKPVLFINKYSRYGFNNELVFTQEEASKINTLISDNQALITYSEYMLNNFNTDDYALCNLYIEKLVDHIEDKGYTNFIDLMIEKSKECNSILPADKITYSDRLRLLGVFMSNFKPETAIKLDYFFLVCNEPIIDKNDKQISEKFKKAK